MLLIKKRTVIAATNLGLSPFFSAKLWWEQWRWQYVIHSTTCKMYKNAFMMQSVQSSGTPSSTFFSKERGATCAWVDQCSGDPPVKWWPTGCLHDPIDTLACTRSPWICSETCYLVKFPNPSIWYLSDIKMSEGLAQNRSNLLCIYEAALDNEGCIWRRNNIYMKCFDRKVIWLIFPNFPVKNRWGPFFGLILIS